MNLALTEMRRAKLRFGLLTGAVALLVFLIVFLSSLSSALLRTITGAMESLPADGVVMAAASRGNLQVSRLSAEVVEKVAAVEGVAGAEGVSVTSLGAQLAGQSADLQLFALTAGEPAGLRTGRYPTAVDEIAVDSSEEVSVGEQVLINGAQEPLVVTGTLFGTQFGADTGWVTQEGYSRVVRDLNPALGNAAVPVNGVMFTADAGVTPVDLAARITSQVPETTGYDLPAAVAAVPGKESIGQTFGLLVGITFAIGVVVVGFFFLILTVQKLKVFTLLRATGATTGRLAAAVTGQIAAVVLSASIFATALAWVALRGLSSGLPVRISPLDTAVIVAAVLGASLVAGLLSVRRIARLDPSRAAGSR